MARAARGRAPAAVAMALVFALASALAPRASAARRLQAVQIFGSSSGVTPVEPRGKEQGSHVPDPKFVEGLVQAGFPRERALEALREVGNENCCQPQISWLFKHSKGKEALAGVPPGQLQCNTRERTDYDGYALKWGSGHHTKDAGECCEACRAYEPAPPHYYPCNVWVFCGSETGKCFAPAAGEFTTGQCWLKYQEDPLDPHVNMQGSYSEQYRRSHPQAPEHVQWTAGSLSPPGVGVGNGTWSSRSHW